MPDPTQPQRADVPGMPDAALAGLLEGGTPPADAPAAFQHVADVLAALRAEPAADETAGRAAAVAEFRRRVGAAPRRSHARQARPAMLMPALRTRAGVAATAAVVGLGGFAAAAYAGALPASAQTVAHAMIGAPAPKHHDGPSAGHSGVPVGPNASGRPASGLCSAYLHGKQHGSALQKSVAFRNLERAAGGAASVPRYCAAVTRPGASQSGARQNGKQPATKQQPTGKSPHP